MSGRNRALDLLTLLVLFIVLVPITSRRKDNKSGWISAFLNGLRLVVFGGILFGIGWLIFG